MKPLLVLPCSKSPRNGNLKIKNFQVGRVFHRIYLHGQYILPSLLPRFIAEDGQVKDLRCRAHGSGFRAQGLGFSLGS